LPCHEAPNARADSAASWRAFAFAQVVCGTHGFREASLARWETGSQIQSESNDNLLRLLADDKNVDALARQSGIALPRGVNVLQLNRLITKTMQKLRDMLCLVRSFVPHARGTDANVRAEQALSNCGWRIDVRNNLYSFKGGVGRTMAVANIGAWLAQNGRRVLLVDFDLEAPGLSSYSLPNTRKIAKNRRLPI
jgi:hypothetical protein